MLETKLHGPLDEEKLKRINILDIIYDMAKTFIFHYDWELRHGGLIYIRAFSRIFKKGFSIDSHYSQPLIEENFKNLYHFLYLKYLSTLKNFTEAKKQEMENLKLLLDERKVIYKTSKEFNEKCEDIKNRCLILISVDRFSDFLADKSNIINRALASEILVNVFEVIPNLTSKLFIFDHLIEKDSKEGWEPKQAIFFFFTQILNAQKEAFEYSKKKQKQKQKHKSNNQNKINKEKNERKLKMTKNFKNVSENLEKIVEDVPQKKKLIQKLSKKHKNLENLKLMEEELEFETFLKDTRMKFLKGPVIDASNLPQILGFIPKIIQEHEEISEVCCEFLLSILKAEYFKIGKDYWTMIQEKLNDCLFNTEDISYLPKSVFEFLIGIINKNIDISPKLRQNLDVLFNKFMFHHNIEVRKEIYKFINKLYSLPSDNINSPQKIFDSEKIKNLFLTFFFYASLSHISFGEISNHVQYSPVSILMKDLQKNKKKKIKQNEINEICEILSNIFNSLNTQKKEIIYLMLNSLDIFELPKLFELTQGAFKFNIENYITEADPQKMIFIVFNILKNFSFEELNQLLEESLNIKNLLVEGENLNVSIKILIGLLALNFRHPNFFTCISYTDLIPKDLCEYSLLQTNFADFLNIQKNSMTIQYLKNQMKTFIKTIETFISSNFAEGKTLQPSVKTQEHIIQIFQLIQKDNLELFIEELLKKFQNFKNHLSQEVHDKKSPLVKTNMVLKCMEDQVISKIKKFNDICIFFNNLCMLVGGIHHQLDLIYKNKLPEKKIINKLILPSISLLNRPITKLFSELISKNLFLLHIIYSEEKKHPNLKVVDSILKSILFTGPKDNKICYFFPTPETDELKFDIFTSLKSCFIKNQSLSYALYTLKREISETPTTLRNENWLNQTFPQLFESNSYINYSNLQDKNIFSVNISNVLDKDLLMSDDESNWKMFFNHCLEGFDTFFFRKNIAQYVFFVNEFYKNEIFEKFKKIEILLEDDHLFIFLYPFLLNTNYQPLTNLYMSCHLFNMYYANFNVQIIHPEIENCYTLIKQSAKATFNVDINFHACIINSFYKLLVIFENLDKADSIVIKLFLLMISSLIQNRKNLGFKFLIHIFKKYKEICISISKLFICEILKALNDTSDSLHKPLVCEAFCLVLTLAYIDESKIEQSKDFFIPVIQNDEYLQVNFNKGKKFLFDFKNYQNFEVFIPPNLTKDQLVLRGYQLEGIKWLNFLWKYELNGILCDDMGLGKTLQSLITVALQVLQFFGPSDRNQEIVKELANPQLLQHNPNVLLSNTAVIVCPNNLVFHWQKECLSRINQSVLNPVIINSYNMSNTSLSKFIITNPYNVLIIGYSTLIKFVSFFDCQVGFIILDEAHMIKNEKSKLAQCIKQVKSKRRLGLTGTPIQNNILELWSIFDFIMPEYLGLKKDFRKQHKDLMNMNMMSLELNKMKLTSAQKRKLEFLHAKVLPFIMRREKKDVLKDLPPKIIQDQQCIMSSEQEKLYKIFASKEFKDLPNLNITESNLENSINVLLNKELEKIKENETNSKQNILKTLNTLRQLVNHPFLLESNNLYSSYISSLKSNLKKQPSFKKFFLGGKFIGLKTILNSLNYDGENIFSCKNNSNKLIIFSRFKNSCQLICQFFSEIFPYIKYIHLSNEYSLKERSDLVDQFQSDKSYKIIILTTKIGGLGLNLSSANVVVMFDHDFNPMNDLQAIDRAHRIGQKKCVNVFRLIIKGISFNYKILLKKRSWAFRNLNYQLQILSSTTKMQQYQM